MERRLDLGRPLRVAVISKADRFGGGASLIAEQLVLSLSAVGHTAHHWVAWWGDSLRPHMRSVYGIRFRKAFFAAHRLVGKLGLQEIVPWEYAILRRHLQDYDVAHFHDICSVISPLTVALVARWMPTVWTFHDCSPFTGGCLYPMDCTKFHRRCGGCPQLGQWPLDGGVHRRLGLRLDFTGVAQAAKRWVARHKRLVAVTPSHWMAGEAMKSGMFSVRPTVIPNWVDMDVFRPGHRPSLRRELGLPEDAFLAFLSSGNLGDKRKGVEFGIASVRRCGRPVGLVLVGNEDPAITRLAQGITTYPTGYLGDRSRLAQYVAACDVALSPTFADNLPCSIMEAMACGTPTIGFRTGGVPDLIEHEVNGWLAVPGDVAGLVEGLQLCFDRPEVRTAWAEAGCRFTAERYHRDVFLRAHLELYEGLLKRGAGELSPFAPRKSRTLLSRSERRQTRPRIAGAISCDADLAKN
jgi:glycosyltransferase involved in cell wall biosynthesis